MASTRAALPVLTLSTDDFAERDRIPAWRDFVGPKLSKLEIEPSPDRDFAWAGTTFTLPRLEVSFVRCSGADYRTGAGFRASDDIGLLLSGSGSWRVWQRDREVVLPAGDGVLASNANLSGLSSLVQAEGVGPHAAMRSLCMPRSALARLVPDIDDALMRPLDRRSDAMRLLNTYLRIFDEPTELASAEAQSLVATHIHDLVALAVGATRDGAEAAGGRGVRAARLRAAKAILARELDNPRLGIGEVALGLGVTPRTVQLLFESEGTTFSRYALELRLQRVHRMLGDPRFTHISISDLAFDAGFGGLTHFNRAFRRQYGATPSEIRAGAGE